MVEHEPVREVYLRPGDFCFGEGRLCISTLLGSCVSIILWHPKLVHGGMCHYMLPSRKLPRNNLALDGKYGDEAMELFMLELKKRRTVPAQYQVHVYGGGSMFTDSASAEMGIGKQNIDKVYSLLEDYGFTLAYDHMGSFGHRKITFDVWNGGVNLIHVDYRKTES